MARVHSLPQAGEMVFLDASGSLDRHNNPVYFLCTHHPSGALPLCVWVTSDASQRTLTCCLEKNKIELHHRKSLMLFVQNMVFAENQDQLDIVYNNLKNDETVKMYTNFLTYIKHSMEKKTEWAICQRKQFLTRGNNTDNYTESMIFIFKCVILRRIRAYNLQSLLLKIWKCIFSENFWH